MIRFALVVASVLGFVLTAALGNMMVPLLRELQRAARGTQPDSDAPDSPVPTMGGLCLMVGTLAAVGVGWLAACAAQPSLLGSDRQMTSRLLIALLGSLAFGAVGLADDLARIRSRYPNGLGLGLRRTQRLALECIAAVLVLGLLALNGCLPTGLILPGAGYVECALAPLLWAVLLVAMAEAARVADGADGTVCGAAFVAMLGLMMLETQLGWFPLAVFPAALAGALMAFLLWDFPPAKLHPGRCGCLYAAGAIGCIPLCIGYAELSIPLALPFWVEGGMVLLQVLFCRWKGRPLFAAAPLHRWLEKRGMSAVNIFYSLCALSVCGLALAVCLAAGLDGIEKGLTPPEEITENIFAMTPAEREAKGIHSLPGTLHDAVVAFQKDKLICDTLGEHIVSQYVAGKEKEWDEYRTHVSDWELGKYLIAY